MYGRGIFKHQVKSNASDGYKEIDNRQKPKNDGAKCLHSKPKNDKALTIV